MIPANVCADVVSRYLTHCQLTSRFPLPMADAMSLLRSPVPTGKQLSSRSQPSPVDEPGWRTWATH